MVWYVEFGKFVLPWFRPNIFFLEYSKSCSFFGFEKKSQKAFYSIQ